MKSLRLHIRLLLVALVFVQGFAAQPSGLSGVNVVIKRISTDQGLSSANVWAITQDNRGFIWIGTDYGLNRFDGKDFMTYMSDPHDTTTLSNSGIWSLFPDSNGILWIGTAGGGLDRFDPVTRTFKRYLHDPTNDSSLSGNDVRSIFRDRAGVLWVGSSRGLNRFQEQTGTWIHYLPNPGDSSRPGDNFITSILEDRQGNFWIGTGQVQLAGGGLYKFDRSQGQFSRYWQNALHPEDPWVSSIMEDRSGTLWITSNWGGIDTLDRSSGKIKHIAFPGEGVPNQFGPFFKSIREDSMGALWVATWGSGLFRYDRHARAFTRYGFEASNPGSLSSPTIECLYTDNAGLLWVGTDYGGANAVASRPFLHRHTLGDSLQIGSLVDVIHADRKGGLWLGAVGTGLWRFDPRTQKSSYHLGLARVQCICEDVEGSVWIMNYSHIDRFDPMKGLFVKEWEVPLFQGRSQEVFSLLVDKERSLWVGTFSCLYRVDKDMKSSSVFAHDPQNYRSISAGFVESLLEDRSGNIWVGTSEGLGRFDKQTQSFTRFFHDPRDSSSLSSERWCTLFEDRSGNLWVGTREGLNRYNRETSNFTRFYPADQGSSRFVGTIQEDDKGRFWYGTGGGIAMFNPSDGSFRAFNQSDGVEQVDITSLRQSCTTLQGGEILFGTASGILAFHPDRVRTLRLVPPIAITGINRFGKPLTLATSAEIVREIAFEHDENVFSIKYAALSYDMPELNQYAYKLEGFDKDWVYCGNRQEATYTNLDPGTYTFCVKGANYDCVWNEAGTSLAVVIRPAYWQTWWFKALMVLALVTIGGTVVGYSERVREKRKIERMEREHALERERARISQDMHDEVGSSLSEIAILSELVKKDLRKPEAAEVQVQQISDRAAELIDNVSEIVWAMNPKNDTLENSLGYIRRYAVKYLSLAGISCEFEAPEAVPASPLTSEVRRNLFLVVKEALHNIEKHACASAVQFNMEISGETVSVRIRDNGKGFILDERREEGNGLFNMRKRIADIGGTFRVESMPGSGTLVTLSIPLIEMGRLS